MSEAPERIWIEDEFGEGDDDQWTYGTWDVRNYRGYDVEYVRADKVQPQIDAAVLSERERCAEVAAKMDGDYIRGKYDIQYNRKRYDAEAVGRVQFKTCCILSEDIAAAIRKGDQP